MPKESHKSPKLKFKLKQKKDISIKTHIFLSVH